MSRMGRVRSLRRIEGRTDDGEYVVNRINRRLGDIADDLNDAVKSSQLSVSDSDFTGYRDTDPDTDPYLENTRTAIESEVDACVDADEREALEAARQAAEALEQAARSIFGY